LIFIGELGDKTQIAAGTGTLANKKKVRLIFFSSALALVAVAGLTVFGAGFISKELIPTIERVGGVLLVLYGLYLYSNADDSISGEVGEIPKNNYVLFISHFSVVFAAELGDKTQIATLAVAVKNQTHLLTVFSASALALVTVTAITVWGITKIPSRWVKNVQRMGALGMIAYGIYMFYSTT